MSTPLLMITFLVRTGNFSSTVPASVLRVSWSAPGLPFGQSRIHLLPFLFEIAAIPNCLTSGLASRISLPLFIDFILLCMLCPHMPRL